MWREIRIDIVCERGDVEPLWTVYATDESGQWSMVGTERFGPFDTELDMAKWLHRTLGGRRLTRAR